MPVIVPLERGERDAKADDDRVENWGGDDGKPATGKGRDNHPVDDEGDVRCQEDRELDTVPRAKRLDFEPHLVHGDVREEEEEKVGEPEEAEHWVGAEGSDGAKPVGPCDREVVLDPHEVHWEDEEGEQKEDLPNVDIARNSSVAGEAIERTPEDLHGSRELGDVVVDEEIECFDALGKLWDSPPRNQHHHDEDEAGNRGAIEN